MLNPALAFNLVNGSFAMAKRKARQSETSVFTLSYFLTDSEDLILMKSPLFEGLADSEDLIPQKNTNKSPEDGR